MKAIILAGGKGERLRPLTNTIPKPMITVGDKPILEHLMYFFKKNKVYDFIFSVCYRKEEIMDYFGDGKSFGVHIEYILEDENKPLGTAGAIFAAKKYIDSTFIVTSGDSLRELNIADMVVFHKKKKAFATLNVYKRFGNNPKSMIVFNRSKKITQFIERPTDIPNDYVWSNGFFYILETQIFDFIQKNATQDFGKDIFPIVINKNKSLFAFPTREYFIDISNTKKLTKAQATFPHLESK